MICLILLVFSFFSVQSLENIIGRGSYRVTNLQQCEGYEQHLFNLELHRRKMNRTHDGFNGVLKIETRLDDSYGIEIKVCKFVDGGCKPFTVLKDESFTKFVEYHIGNNVEKILSAAGVEPARFPIEPCEKKITGYLFNYEELPHAGLYGSFHCHTTVLQRNGDDNEVVGCLDVTFEFKANNDIDII